MKLTPEVIASSDSSLSPLKDRELDLRGLKIPAIENLGVTRDQNDSLDLTDNDIRTLSNFPHLSRLSTLILSNNLVTRIDARLAHSLPRLQTLVLTNNQLSELGALAPLGKLPLLEYLSLMGNEVSRKPNYREYLVWRCKKLRVLDFKRIKDKERALAKQLMETSDGRPSALAAQIENSAAALSFNSAPPKSKTFEPGSLDASNGRGGAAKAGAAGRLMSPAERKALEDAIEKSQSLEEIRRLEDKLRLGYAIDS